MAIIDVAVVLNLVNLAIFASRVVHNHHVVALQILADILLVETLRRVTLRADHLATLVVSRPLEFGWRHTHTLGEYAVYLGEHHNLTLCALLGFERAQFECKFAQFERENRAHVACIFALVGLRHCRLRHCTVLHNEVRYARKLTSVADWVFEQPLDLAILQWKVARVDYRLQKEVRFFEQIVERTVVLRELEFAQLVSLNHLGSQYIKTCKEPTATRRFLVGDALRLDAMREVRVAHCEVVAIGRECRNVGRREGIFYGSLGSRVGVSLAQRGEHLLVNASVLALCRCADERCRGGDGQYDSGQFLFHSILSIKVIRVVLCVRTCVLRECRLLEKTPLENKQIDDCYRDISVGKVENCSEKVVVRIDQERQPIRTTVPLE